MQDQSVTLDDDAELRSEEHTPLKYRDMCCIFFFVVTVAFFVFASAFAFTYGNPENLLSPALGFIETEFDTFAIQEFAILRHDILWLLLAIGASLILAILWFFLVKNLSTLIVYASIAAGVATTAFLGFYVYTLSRKFHSFELLLLATIFWTIALGIFILALVFKHKIIFTSEMIRQAGQVLKGNLSLLSVVILSAVIYFALSIFSALVMLYLYTVPIDTTATTLTTGGNPVLMFSTSARIIGWLFIIASLWFTEIIMTAETFIVAGVTIHELDRTGAPGYTRMEASALWKTTRRAFLQSFGTIIFGAAVNGIVAVFNVLSKHFRNTTGNNTLGPYRWIYRLAEFLVESIVEFSIIYAAITGLSFASSARRAVYLLKKDLALTLGSQLIIAYILTTGQVVGASFITVVSIWLIETTHQHVGAIVIAAIFVSSYFIFNVVSRAFASIANTLFIVILMDHNKTHSRVPDPVKILIDQSPV